MTENFFAKVLSSFFNAPHKEEITSTRKNTIFKSEETDLRAVSRTASTVNSRPKRKRKRVKKIPQPEHNAHSVEYRVQNDGTSLDDFIKIISEGFDGEIEQILVGGLSGIPPYRKFRDQEHVYLSKDPNSEAPWIKRYYVKIFFDKNNSGLMKTMSSLSLPKNSTDFKSEIYDVRNETAKNYLLSVCPQLNEYSKKMRLSIGFSTQTLRLIFRLKLPIRARDIIIHCGTGHITEFAKNLREQFILKCENDLQSEHHKGVRLYNDYSFRKKFFKNRENQLRLALNVPEIGKANVSQYLLYTLVMEHFSSVKYEYSPAWLGRQRYDIYIPKHKVAIEYNGQQHYMPIEIWGGEEGFAKQQARDREKVAKSRANNVELRVWRYDREITRENVKHFLRDLV